MKTIRAVELFFQEGTSDKVYNARIVEEGSGLHTVQVEWGRRGSPLNSGLKGAKLTLEKANRTVDSLIREKTNKGYQEITRETAPAAVAPPVGQGSASRVAGSGRKRTGQAAQLLNAVEEAGLEALLRDPEVVAQQKFDGNRVLVRVGKSAAETVATNRVGQHTELDATLLAALSEAPPGTFLDGELLRGADGPEYRVFDLLQHGSEDLRGQGYLERLAELDALIDELAPPVRLVPTARSEAEKRALLESLQGKGAEGIVFKRGDAAYTAGRPSSGGGQLKYKFIKSADVFLTANAGNAYQMAVHDRGQVRLVGKVFAGTTNASRKQIDALLAAGEQPVAEVRYLYATDDDNLFQPVFAQLRDDKEPADCLLSQLVRTNREVVAEARPPRPRKG